MLPFVAAAAMVLLALGCFTKDTYGSVVTKDEHVTADQNRSLILNEWADVLTFGSVLFAVRRYYTAAAKALEVPASGQVRVRSVSAGSTGSAGSAVDEPVVAEGTPASAAEPLRLSPILYAIAMVEAMELTAGLGTPYAGEDLREGARRGAELHQQLQSAYPDDGWRGVAAGTYGEQVAALQDAAQLCIRADEHLADAAQYQAEWVTQVRGAFGLVKAVLVLAHIAEVKMYFTKGWNPWARPFALGAACAGVAAGLVIVTVGGCVSSAYADHVMAVGHEYGRLPGSGTGTATAPTLNQDQSVGDQVRIGAPADGPGQRIASF